MPRLPAAVTITIRFNDTGERHRVELIRQPWPGRVWVRIDGRNSRRLPEATVTRLAAVLRRWVTRRLAGPPPSR